MSNIPSFKYTIIDKFRVLDSGSGFYPVAECAEFADAELICNALNAH